MTLGMHLGCVLETACLAQGSSAKETFEDLVGGRVSGTWVSCCQEGLACQVGLMVASPFLELPGDGLASVVFVGAAAPVAVVVVVVVVAAAFAAVVVAAVVAAVVVAVVVVAAAVAAVVAAAIVAVAVAATAVVVADALDVGQAELPNIGGPAMVLLSAGVQEMAEERREGGGNR